MAAFNFSCFASETINFEKVKSLSTRSIHKKRTVEDYGELQNDKKII